MVHAAIRVATKITDFKIKYFSAMLKFSETMRRPVQMIDQKPS